MDILDRMILIFLELTVAGYVLLALLLFTRALSTLVNHRHSVKGPAHANRPDRKAKVVSESGVQGMISGGTKVRSWAPSRVSAPPPQEGADVKAQAAKSGEGEQRAA